MQVTVREEYSAYTPERAWKPYVEDLMRVVPREYLRGLGFVLLTDSEGKSRAERRAKLRSRHRKVLRHKCLGYYRHASTAGPAFIVIHVDQIDAQQKSKQAPIHRDGLRYRVLRTLTRPIAARRRFARVLFHEIGHHIHETQVPQFREPESVAESYCWKLMSRLFIRRWYLAAMGIGAMSLLFPRVSWGVVRNAFQKDRPRKTTRKCRAKRR